MKKTNVIKILKIVLLLFIFNVMHSNNVFASEASVSANNCNVGEDFTVTVNIPQDVSGYDIGGIKVAYSDGSTSSAKRAVKANMDLSWPGNYSVTFPAKVAGNATISVNSIILVNSSQAVVNANTTLETTISISDPAPAPAEDNSQPEQQEPEKEVVLNFSNISEKMYTNRRINVRQNYGTDSGIIQTLPVGTEVTRTGVSDGNKNGYSWSRISYNGITGYVITGALTYDAPEGQEKEEENKEEEQKPEEEVSEDKQAKIAAIAEEKGTIPEVGVNIMPYMFLGTVGSCLVMMFEIKRKLA